MTEIRLDVELAHPPDRVWRALTESRVLDRWFLPIVTDPADRNRFTVRSSHTDGFGRPVAGRIVESVRPQRLVLGLESDDLHVRVTVTLDPRPGGCRLTFVQRGFLGPQGTLRRRVLRATYTRMLTERLPEALATEQVPTEPVPTASGNAAAALRREGGRGGNARARWVRLPRASLAGAAALVRPRDGSGKVYGQPAAGGRGPGSVVAAVATRVRGRAAVPGPAPVPAHTRAEARTRRAARTGSTAGSTGAIGRRVHARRPAHGAASAARAGRPGPARRRFQVLLREGLAWLRAIPGWSAERRSRAVALGALLLLLVALVMVLVARFTVRLENAPPQVGGTDPNVPGFAVVPGQSARPLGTASASGSAAAGRPDGAAAGAPSGAASGLTGGYRTADTWVGGYRGEITITNPGAQPVAGWTATITLPLLGVVVDSVHGAESRQTGKTVTFTPMDTTRSVSPGASVRFDFAVKGVGAPSGCTVDNHACTGLSG